MEQPASGRTKQRIERSYAWRGSTLAGLLCPEGSCTLFGMFERSGTEEIFTRCTTYIEVAHIAHEDIKQRAMTFGVAIPVMALKDRVFYFSRRVVVTQHITACTVCKSLT
jgi:hypothetical protein